MTSPKSALEHLAAAAGAFALPPVVLAGTVDEATPSERFVRGLSHHAALGDQLEIAHGHGNALAEIIHIDRERCLAALYERRGGAFLGAPALLRGPLTLAPHESWLGRAIDALGRPIDGEGALMPGRPRSTDADPPPAVGRRPLARPLRTGVKAIDLFAPLWKASASVSFRRFGRRQVDASGNARRLGAGGRGGGGADRRTRA
ncbi:MAG: hypothetical protein AcusKO_19490 [Acuticoccus sp.]